MPLNRYISLHGTLVDGEIEGVLLDVIPDACVIDPERIFIDKQVWTYLMRGVHSELSALESQVLRCYLEGMWYHEMARALACHTKSVDNALQRAKRKIGQHIAGD